MKIRDLISEAPLQDYVPLGKFDKPGPFRGVDKRLVPHEQNRVKAVKFFDGTSYDFRLFFSNISGTQVGNQEQGSVDHSRVVRTFGPEIANQIIANSETAITVVFLGNYGDQKVMMTPWIMAHRLGHAIQASGRRDQGPFRAWTEVDRHFHKNINDMLVEYYRTNSNDAKTHAALFNAIGTQRSSRDRQITRPYEFMYEMFAQYIKTGDVKFNPLPRKLGYGHQAWGNPTRNLIASSQFSDEDLASATDVLSNDMRILFGDVLAECEGHIFFM